MATYPQKLHLYIYPNNEQLEITGDVVSDIEAEWGIPGNTVLDNLAQSGALKFNLLNTSQKYTPDALQTLSGWEKGVRVEFVIDYNNGAYKRFVGTLDSIKLNDDNTVSCLVLDWIDYSAKCPIKNAETAIEQKADEVINILTLNMPHPPANSLLDKGNEVFPIIFDSVDLKTKIYTEFARLVNSEFGYLYLQHDKKNGETLVFENNQKRNGNAELSTFPRPIKDCDIAVNSTGGKVLNSTGGRIRFQNQDAMVLDNCLSDVDISYGDDMVNQMVITANPKTYDASEKVLFSLAEPIKLATKEAITITSEYKDPNNGNSITVITGSMIQPVAVTDYTANSKKNGAGKDLTSYVSASAIFGSGAVKINVADTSGCGLWLTKMQIRGYGIYPYSQIETIEEDEVSISNYDYQNIYLNQIYQKDLILGRQVAKKAVEYGKSPRTKLNEVIFIPNSSEHLMNVFLNADIGSLIEIRENKNNIDGYFYIQNIQFTILRGGVIMVKYLLRNLLVLGMGLSLVACNFKENSRDALCYGNLKQIVDLPKVTFSADIYPTGYPTPEKREAVIASGWVSDQGGFEISYFLYTIIDGEPIVTIKFIQVHPTTYTGYWYTTNPVPINQWSKVVITLDSTGEYNPTIYVDGIEQPLTAWLPPSGPVGSNDGMDFCIGNIHGQADDTDLNKPFIGKIYNVRIFDRILSTDEVKALSAGASIKDGLVFQGPALRTVELMKTLDKYLTIDNKVLDSVFGEVGTPSGSPTLSNP